MSELLSEVLVLATVTLIALPLLSRRYRGVFRPREHVRFDTVTIASGIVLLETALAVCAVPIIAPMINGGADDRHFFPGDTLIGWVSAGLAIMIAASLVAGAVRYRRVEKRLRVEPWIGIHTQHDEYTLVILDADQPIAYAIGGRGPQIVLTTALVARFDEAELAAVIGHELAHIRLGHRRVLSLLEAMAPLATFLRPLRRVVAAARIAVEHAADVAAGDTASIRFALMKVGTADIAPSVAAFAVGEIAERISALDAHRAPHRHPGARLGLYSIASALALLSVLTLALHWA